MKKVLFEKTFEKAKNQSGKSTKHGLSSYLANLITDDFNFSVNAITFVRYYEKYIDNNLETTYNPSSDLLDILSKYLGYDKFENFVLKMPSDDINLDVKNTIEGEKKLANSSTKLLSFIVKNKIVILLSLLITVIMFTSISKQRWMIWEGNHYIEIKFNADTYSLGKIKLYNQDRIENFRKITPVCNSTIFFNEDGRANIWYGKNRNKEIEYFTTVGKHPETGKTLKAITPYIINKYICKKQ